MRNTVEILMPGETSPRYFHLESAKAERFAASIRAQGGQATIGPLNIGNETAALLARIGRNVA